MSPSYRGATKFVSNYAYLSGVSPHATLPTRYLLSTTASQDRYYHNGNDVRQHQKYSTSSTKRDISSTVIAPPTGSAALRPPEIHQEVDRCYQRLDLSFENPQEAFKVAPVAKKLSMFGVKSILDYSVESDITQEEAEEKAIEGIIGKEHVSDAIISSDFVDKEAVDITHQRYTVHKEFGDRRVNVVSARTYFYAGEEACDKNADIFCDCIDTVADITNGQGFMAIKLTALGRPQLLLKLSETIAQTQNFFKALTGSTWENLVLSRIDEDNFLQRLEEFGIKTDSNFVKEWFKIVDFDDDGFVDFYDWGRLLDDNPNISKMFQVLNIKSGKLEPLITNLSTAEQNECSNMMQRLVRVADYAASRGIRIMIDAEQTYFQPAISRLSVALMRKYNKNGGQILNTYQAYLKNSLAAITIDMHLARRENFHFGCKLVRGAYMDQERKRAKAIGYDDPINPNYDATSDMYHRCLERIVDERDIRGSNQVSVMVASHNEETIRYAVQLMKDRCIAPSERVICFAQLYGMCDQVSFTLGQAGYSVYKYLPYGPVEEVLPYLSRRALENGSLLSSLNKERRLLWSELKRRVGAGQLLYTVPTS